MDIREIKSIIESLLFTWGDPLNIKDISKILDVSERMSDLWMIARSRIERQKKLHK